MHVEEKEKEKEKESDLSTAEAVIRSLKSAKRSIEGIEKDPEDTISKHIAKTVHIYQESLLDLVFCFRPDVVDSISIGTWSVWRNDEGLKIHYGGDLPKDVMASIHRAPGRR